MYLKNFKQWLKCATVRAVKTIAQTAVSTIGVTAMMNEVNWVAVVSASLLSGILSMLTSISGLPEVKEDTTNAKGN
ncbi:MAG: holin [Ruminococcus sp.]|nr:holin [Ruminococcus sp.]MCI5598698.1 holin [Ruminococcus sp.]MCI5617289.1 holin [Ruminococcus sp.]MCI6506064.1 holin [Ruminococcus sp.]MDD6710200.1 holin [Ruminococcus sp.]